jgi:CheY-like chemotaxis protein
MAILLRLCGHEVAIARNGPVALAKARAEKPDVVLLDLGLPLRSGCDVAKELSRGMVTVSPTRKRGFDLVPRLRVGLTGTAYGASHADFNSNASSERRRAAPPRLKTSSA